jgi:predicted nucleotidyltransferase
MLLQDLENKGLIQPPSWLSSNCHYLTIMGSVAYGTSSDTSDMDLYGFVIPKRDMVFPHLAGFIPNFGTQPPQFDQWQQHGVVDQSALAGKGRIYDFTIFNIIKYFDLCMAGNPNMTDSLFVPQDCILHITQVGNMVRENRTLFLSKIAFQKYKGYAFSQLKKINTKDHAHMDDIKAFEQAHKIPNTITFEEVMQEYNTRDTNVQLSSPLSVLTNDELDEYCKIYKAMKGASKRAERVKIHTFDLKFSYHLIRLLNEIEQILMYGDLDLRQNREQLKAIRRGDISQEDITKMATEKEMQLEKLYLESKLRDKPDEPKIKQLLLNCLEYHYGSLSKCIESGDKCTDALKGMREILDKVGL